MPDNLKNCSGNCLERMRMLKGTGHAHLVMRWLIICIDSTFPTSATKSAMRLPEPHNVEVTGMSGELKYPYLCMYH